MENPKSAPTGCYKCGKTGHWSHDCPEALKSDHPNPGKPGSGIPNPVGKGCYKCGRPGHWARDCPDQPNLNASSAASAALSYTPNQLPRPEKPKKVSKSRTRPKLTPELLLSDDGIGYILRHFPRAFRDRGRSHEASDLRNLIGLYREWHKYLLPYYSFAQFVHKVDKVASSKRVKNCVRDLRERVARGGDPTKLHESPDEFNGPSDGQVAGHSEEQTHAHYEVDHVDDIQDSMLNEIYQKVSEEPSHEIPTPMVSAEELAASGSRPEQMPNNEANCSTEVHITEEQRARMEANKLKALDRAASASSDQITEEQRARMEANRLKALERAAARARSLQSA
ncbi:hypothetical protein ES332_A03G135500v1 [Gossypium tomentosum]|uniref:CCHC-type domain-containing protein n=1 Tax=Gossypium tomentosum TaxID=34277 RepID=A0A5D2R6N4_GOSTO|nr:hypothetical protein ES332_A03G135500v1 [Gossypium tomentosum]